MAVKNRKARNHKTITLHFSLPRIYERFIRIRGRPGEIAFGFALGLFIGMSPTMGGQMAIAVFLAALLKWNKISAATGVWITNPLTAPFVYSMTYLTGAKILGIDGPMQGIRHLGTEGLLAVLSKAPEIFWALIVGGVIIGLPVSAIGYYIAYSLVTRYQTRRRKPVTGKKGGKG